MSIAKKIQAILVDFSKKHTWFRSLLRKGMFIKDKLKYRRYAHRPVENNVVLFEVFVGRKYADSPKAIYEYLLKQEEYKDFKFVWFFTDCEKYRFLEKNRNTKVVKFGSMEYYKYYATSKYWVTNSRISDAIRKKSGQIYIQCWHGTPLKRLGFDIDFEGENAMNTKKDIRYKYQVDSKKYTFMISSSAYSTEKFASAFNLKAIGREGLIIEEGYPRNDFLTQYTSEDVERIKELYDIPRDKKVILYAPTWRDNQHESGLGYTYKNEVDFDHLREVLGEEYVILFRAHYFVSNSFDFEAYKGFVYNVSDVDDINELYIVSDMLITDYSSVFFDYSILQRPIIFYMYDLEDYRDHLRGFYLGLEELPGKIVQEENDLIEEIRGSNNWKLDEKYIAFNNKFTYLDDGHATERFVKRIREILQKGI